MCRTYGARVSSLVHPGLPAWANSFRASGAADRAQRSGMDSGREASGQRATSTSSRDIGRSKTLTTHSTSLRAGYGHEGTPKGFWRKCLASAFTLLTSSGFLSRRRMRSATARNDRGGMNRRDRRDRARSPGAERQKRQPPIRLRSGRATDTKEHEGILEKMPCICLYAANHPRGSSLAVACAPPSLGMTEGDGIANIAVIARPRRDRRKRKADSSLRSE
jgi:hypothetical protein